ncbi:MAG TPA: hypothetical protein VEW26_00555 [Allosphingosinicella sp.]|nr:hypothetical protein [Allosphingosinicella sp.]
MALPAKAEEERGTSVSFELLKEIPSLSERKPSVESLMPGAAQLGSPLLNDAQPIQEKT